MRLLSAFACLLVAAPAFAQSANPESRPGPPPRTVTVAPPCPEGQIYDLGVCVPRMSDEDTQRCREAFEGAAMVAPAERAELLSNNCIVVPLPDVCDGLTEPGACTRAICAAGDALARPQVCDAGDLDLIITPRFECEFDATSMVPAILAELAPEARALTAEIAAMALISETLSFDPAMVLSHHARQVDTAISARQMVSTFLAVRFAMCRD